MTLFRRHPVLASLFALALMLTLFFAGRFVAQVIYWSDPARQEQQVEGWMTLRYVARSWQLAPRDLYEAAGLPAPVRGSAMTLEQLAEDRGIPLSQLIAEIEASILHLRAAPTGAPSGNGASAP
ncbi:hypothetical protein [Pseudotabrizicola algicola]|uniref:Uncharacterized protein n=1 Tax=Pseudotabrizicola algicola TaxID=2709381 RepID=A0A6B3RPN2_9RHOB|nr:hypothetical protein [Pseudotabrizicola algicola]NEX47186.1 hypothetical protein [Pseudotabrizicola algicola]